MEKTQVEWWERQRADKQRYLVRMAVFEFFVLFLATEGIRWIDPERAAPFVWPEFLIRLVILVLMSIAGAYFFYWLGERHYRKLLDKDKGKQ